LNDITTIAPYIKSKDPLKLRSNNKKILDLPIWDLILETTYDVYSDKARIYLYVMNKSHIECRSIDCKNHTKFDNEKNLFRQYCSITCRNKDSVLRKQISKSWTEEKKITKNKKTKNTCRKKYGVDNHMQVPVVQKKVKETCILKYGAVSSTYKHFTNIKDYNKQYIIKNFITNNILDIDKMVLHFNISKSNINKRMQYLNIVYTNGLISSPEKEVADFVESLGLDIKQSDRTLISPLELDILIPDYKVAIEFNGLYWHSYGLNNVNDKQNNLNYNKNRHIKKTVACESKGYQLFHIFENEWEKKKEIWKSQIRNALGKVEFKIGARECYIKEIDNSLTNNFLDENHLQGKCQSSIQLGLFSNATDELVSVMTFGKSRYDKNISFELIRFCSKLNLQVPGAASKLLKYFEIHYKPDILISYANRRWSNGNLYKTLNFKHNTISNPNYFYFKNNELYSRIKFQKHKLEALLDTFDSEKTEIQNMIENKYRVIYDSGNMSFIKNYLS
jgi:G:T-mismatch repair DNA endonuclease (very short patch repair protein)